MFDTNNKKGQGFLGLFLAPMVI